MNNKSCFVTLFYKKSDRGWDYDHTEPGMADPPMGEADQWRREFKLLTEAGEQVTPPWGE